MKKIILLLLTLGLFQSCFSFKSVTKKAMLVNTENGERISATFQDNSGTGGTCTAIMPNGEILTGMYAGVRGTDVISFGSTNGTINTTTDYTNNGQNVLNAETGGNYSATGSTRTVGGQGKARAILYSTTPNSKLVLELIIIYNVVSGGGYGDAKTNDGRTYKVIIE